MNKIMTVAVAAVLVAVAGPRERVDQPAASAQSEEEAMTDESASQSLRGRTIRWTFDDGPMAATAFEHEFLEDGSVIWRALDGEMKGASGHEPDCATARVSENVFVISYLGRSGYTLTVALNTDVNSMLGFASNGKEWHEMRGTFELVGDRR